MKHFFSRVYSMHPLAMAAGVCLILLTIPATVLLWREAVIAPGSAERALHVEGDKTRAAVLDWMTTHVAPVVEGNPIAVDPLDRLSLRTLLLTEVDRQATGLQAQIVGVRGELFDRVDKIHDSLFVLTTAALSEIDKARENANVQLTLFNRNAALLGVHAGDLMDTYAELPDRLQASATWKALEPEFTCRQADGSGFGGCWHGRITALLGESVKVGGTFTQRFPQMADAVTGMMQDGHEMTSIGRRWAAKNVDPHPATKKEKLETVGKIAVMLAYAALIGGAI